MVVRSKLATGTLCDRHDKVHRSQVELGGGSGSDIASVGFTVGHRRALRFQGAGNLSQQGRPFAGW